MTTSLRLAALFLFFYGCMHASYGQDTYVDIAIVGSGASGIAAAASLAKQGFKVVVLEAADRTGGRVFTGDPFGFPIDLGGAWIHNDVENPLFGLAESLGITPMYTDYNKFIYFKDGAQLDQTTVDEGWDAWEDMYSKLATDARTASDAETLQMAFDKRLSEYPDQKVKEWLKFELENSVAASAAEDPHRMSLRGSLIYGGYEKNCQQPWHSGDGNYLLPEGYRELWENVKAGAMIPLDGDVPHRRLGAIHYMVPSNGKDWEIWTNSKVTKITYSGSTTLLSVEGSTANIVAKVAIVTVSLGVLKSGAIEFDPPLPDPKKEAITRSEMGSYEKVILKFPAIPDPLKGIPGLFDVSAVLNEQMGEFQNLESYNDVAEPVIVGTVHGDIARRLQKDKTKAVAEVTAILKKNIPGLQDPVDSFVTDWTSNPLTLGSYSQWPPTLTVGDKLALQEPVKSPNGALLLFAGEGTQICDLGTVHGAMLSGLRAAQQTCVETNHDCSKLWGKPEYESLRINMLGVGIIAGLVAVAVFCTCLYFVYGLLAHEESEEEEEEQGLNAE